MSEGLGIVYLVGAGPGDPGLMTVRSLELLVAADVIVHDRLIPADALAPARPGAEVIFVGKRPGDAGVQQDQIGQVLVDRARQGKIVVRLKGGDPFVFGRGGEEAEALAREGIPFEVVPGITAGVAASAYAGIPVTHREDASAVAFVTGHEDPDKEEDAAGALDYDALASFPGTLVFYMGVKALPRIAERLTASGRDPEEPAAVIERGTLPGQRTVRAPLAELPAAAAEAEIRPPAITVVGAAAARREAIAWFERRPLHGVRVVVTRARPQASELSRRLAALGAEPVELPAIRIEPRLDTDEVRRMVEGIHSYALVCLTSANAARLLFEAMAEQGRDARALANAVVAAIGPGTVSALAENGVIADVVPERSVAESLVEALKDLEAEGQARAGRARGGGTRGAARRPARAGSEAGRGQPLRDRPRTTRPRGPGAGAGGRLRHLHLRIHRSQPGRGARRGPTARARIVSIGPVTSEAAREAGLEVHVEASESDLDGLVDALLADSSRDA